jgi:hypothetical protein
MSASRFGFASGRREIRKIYDNPAGTRRAIISFGRKNAKTTLAAFLLLLHTCGPEARPNSQLNSAAQSKDQAAILFKLAAKVVRLSPDLNAVIVIRDTVKELFCPELGTLYKALSAEASTAYGLSRCSSFTMSWGRCGGRARSFTMRWKRRSARTTTRFRLSFRRRPQPTPICCRS